MTDQTTNNLPPLPEHRGWQWLDTANFRKALPESALPADWNKLYTADQMQAYARAALAKAEQAGQRQEAWQPCEFDEIADASKNLAPWLSAALDDPLACDEFKKAVDWWFQSGADKIRELPKEQQEAWQGLPLETLHELAEMAWRAGWKVCHESEYCGKEAEDKTWGMDGANVVLGFENLLREKNGFAK